MTAGSFEKAPSHDVHMTGKEKKNQCLPAALLEPKEVLETPW